MFKVTTYNTCAMCGHYGVGRTMMAAYRQMLKKARCGLALSRMDTSTLNKAETVRSDPLQSGSDAATDEAR
jgi:hypothetical protein